MQHLRDAGRLENSPRDIGPLMKEVNEDVLKECKEEITKALFDWAWKNISRGFTNGLPKWYKEELVKRPFNEGEPAEPPVTAAQAGFPRTSTASAPSDPSSGDVPE